MGSPIPGIHHVTAIVGDPRTNLAFYSGVLGLRLVKKTVNFDDSTTYHLYYGDGIGSPGTILTVFPWPLAQRGRRGTGQATVTSFMVPLASLDFWIDRLGTHGVAVFAPEERFGERVVAFDDPDGLRLELVASGSEPRGVAWNEGPVPTAFAIRGLHGVTLTEARPPVTDAMLTAVLGFREIGREGDRTRYQAAENGVGAIVDVIDAPTEAPGRVAVGTVHHVAWRTPSDETQRAWRNELIEHGLGVSPVMDRQYFHSIYFREPGGVLFEIATDAPGFAIDEAPTELGTGLRLPPWLEPSRTEIEELLPVLPLRLGDNDAT